VRTSVREYKFRFVSSHVEAEPGNENRLGNSRRTALRIVPPAEEIEARLPSRRRRHGGLSLCPLSFPEVTFGLSQRPCNVTTRFGAKDALKIFRPR
jgi:hypothetical protein